jgi:ATP-dependent DNA helicase RecG
VDTSTALRKKTKLSKSKLESAILALCTMDYKSLDEIGSAINKAPKYLKNNIISSLVESKKLERLHPNTPNHPNQAYKTASKD